MKSIREYRTILIAIPLFFLIYAFLSCFKSAIVDDAFITFQYARNLLSHGNWGFFPETISNTATSPLNVIVLAIVGSVVGGDIPRAVIIVSSICYVGIFCFLVALSKKLWNSPLIGTIIFMLLLFHPWFLSTIGMESLLFSLFFIAALYFYSVERWHALAISCALMTLARFDGILFFLLFLAFAPTLKTKFRCATLYLMMLLPWVIFSWIYLGSIVPDTLLIKIGQRSWGKFTYGTGIILYFKRYPIMTAAALSFFPLFIFLPQPGEGKDAKLAMIMILGCGIHYAAYSFLSPPPYHWYYLPLMLTSLIGGIIILGIWISRNTGLKRALIAGLLGGYVLFFCAITTHCLVKDDFRLKESPVHTNWASQKQYKNIALWLKENVDPLSTIATSAEIGTLAFFSERYLLNSFSDRTNIVRRVKRQLKNSGGLEKLAIRANYTFLNVENDFEDPLLELVCYRDNRHTYKREIIKAWMISSKWGSEKEIVFSKREGIN